VDNFKHSLTFSNNTPPKKQKILKEECKSVDPNHENCLLTKIEAYQQLEQYFNAKFKVTRMFQVKDTEIDPFDFDSISFYYGPLNDLLEMIKANKQSSSLSECSSPVDMKILTYNYTDISNNTFRMTDDEYVVLAVENLNMNVLELIENGSMKETYNIPFCLVFFEINYMDICRNHFMELDKPKFDYMEYLQNGKISGGNIIYRYNYNNPINFIATCLQEIGDKNPNTINFTKVMSAVMNFKYYYLHLIFNQGYTNAHMLISETLYSTDGINKPDEKYFLYLQIELSTLTASTISIVEKIVKVYVDDSNNGPSYIEQLLHQNEVNDMLEYGFDFTKFFKKSHKKKCSIVCKSSKHQPIKMDLLTLTNDAIAYHLLYNRSIFISIDSEYVILKECGHIFHKSCMVQFLNKYCRKKGYEPIHYMNCPYCGVNCGPVVGEEEFSILKYRRVNGIYDTIPGYPLNGIILVQIYFKDEERDMRLYLPYNKEGMNVFNMVLIAWSRHLMQITCESVLPDSKQKYYLNRNLLHNFKAELLKKGVPENINTDFIIEKELSTSVLIEIEKMSQNNN